MLTCCNEKPKWVENVRDKGYWFCDTCRKEVAEVTRPTLEILDEDIDDIAAVAAINHLVGLSQIVCAHDFKSNNVGQLICKYCGINYYVATAAGPNPVPPSVSSPGFATPACLHWHTFVRTDANGDVVTECLSCKLSWLGVE